ncbi:hypothetical protein FRC16_010586 [Serendipita sp. 398]|nr:hypothetical protein FRC16_010586 [Serendipita sp. 398]
MATRLILRASSSRISVRASLQSNTRQALWFPSQARFITTKKFTPEHEYISYDSSSKIGVMSITDYAQKSLGDVVFVELPVVGTSIGKGGTDTFQPHEGVSVVHATQGYRTLLSAQILLAQLKA